MAGSGFYLQILDHNGKACQGANALTYFVTLLMTKKKRFLTLAPARSGSTSDSNSPPTALWTSPSPWAGRRFWFQPLREQTPAPGFSPKSPRKPSAEPAISRSLLTRRQTWKSGKKGAKISQSFENKLPRFVYNGCFILCCNSGQVNKNNRRNRSISIVYARKYNDAKKCQGKRQWWPSSLGDEATSRHNPMCIT